MLFKKFKTKKQLYKEIEKLNTEISELKNAKDNFFKTHREISVQTLTASCISWYENNNFERSKETVCYELANQLMPYVNFEHCKIVDGSHPDKMKHTGTIRILELF